MSITATTKTNNVKNFILHVVPVTINIDLLDDRQGQIDLHANSHKPSTIYIKEIVVILIGVSTIDVKSKRTLSS